MPEGYNGAYTGQQIDEGIAKTNAALPAPTGGTAGQVLKKTETGTEWGDVDGGLTQEQADERYLQLSGGEVTGSVSVYDSIKIGLFQAVYPRPETPRDYAVIKGTMVPVQNVIAGGDTGLSLPLFTTSASGSVCASLGNKRIESLGDPTGYQDAANKRYVDSKAPKSVAVTLSTSGWSNNAQTVTVTGVLADETAQLIQPMPAVASQASYMSAGIYCSGQAADSLTFTCSETPTEDIALYIVITEVGA